MHFTREKWSQEAAHGMRDAYGEHGADEVAEWIASGRCELWRINGDSWLVTEVQGSVLFVWLYQGRGVKGLTTAMRAIAKKNGLRAIQFNTRRAGFLRMLEPFGVELVGREDNGLLICEVPA